MEVKLEIRKYLKRTDREEIWPWTEHMALRGDMVLCDSFGNPLPVEKEEEAPTSEEPVKPAKKSKGLKEQA